MRKALLLSAAIMLTTIAAFADIARPGKAPNRVEKPAAGLDGNLLIRLDRNATEAKLIIPRSQIPQLRAELERLDGNSNVAAFSEGSFSRTQTIISGIFLSLAIAFGGMWFMRSNAPPAGKVIAVVAAFGVIGTAASIAYANVGPPPSARKITSLLFDKKIFTPYGFATGKIKVETSDDTAYILVVPAASPNSGGDE
ncbi:MAG: hypothetical protein AB7J13_16750 [Pyrinomonadaceae bacterium]